PDMNSRCLGRAAAIGLVAALTASVASAVSVNPLTLDEKRQFNYAFATEIGSGIYQISGRTLQIYTLPMSYPLHDQERSRRGWTFTFPVTFGFFSFSPDDIVESGLGPDVATLSFVPGIEYLVSVRPGWRIRPFVEAGRVWDRTGGANATVSSTGLRSRAEFAAGRFDLTLGDSLVFSLLNGRTTPHQDSLVMLETAFEARHLFAR